LAAGCSDDPATSGEYLALETERNELAGQLESAHTEHDQLTEQVGALEAEAEVEGLQTELEALESKNTTLTEPLDTTEAELAAQMASDAVWPQDLKDTFVEGCLEDPTEGATAEQATAICACTDDGLEEGLTLTEFFGLAMAMASTDVELDPITGFPKDMPNDQAETIFPAVTTCMFDITGEA